MRLLISEWGGKLSLTSSWVLPEQGKSLRLQALKACTPHRCSCFSVVFLVQQTFVASGEEQGRGRQENGACVLSRGTAQQTPI